MIVYDRSEPQGPGRARIEPAAHDPAVHARAAHEPAPKAHGRGCCGVLRALLALCLLATPIAHAASAPEAPTPVKVLIVNMFSAEAAPWVAALGPLREIPVPGLSSDYPQLRCNADGVCQMTTGMGHANAAASMMAVLFSGRFDLRRAYFLIAGIAGIDPARGTIGSAAWTRYVVDMGIAHEIDARDLPPGWHDGYFGVLTDSPDVKPSLDYRTEVYKLDESLLQRALQLSHAVQLEDSPDVIAYRRHYPHAPANAGPMVIQCDTLTDDAWWAGRHLGEHAGSWMRLMTDGAGVYCTTQQEDNATLAALTRGSQSGLADLGRVAVLRTGSDFDRPYPGQSTPAELHAQRNLDGALRISTDNLVRAGMPLVHEIVQHWDRWQNGVPPSTAP